jgi:predicted TIM-barrel fold metal-dependent hydrolase
MIVDAHTHIYEYPDRYTRRPAGTGDLLREMDDAGVDVSIVIPLPEVASNEYVQQACAAHPDRLVALYTPDFSRPSETIEKMKHHFAHHPAHGIKIHPRLQGVNFQQPIVQEVTAWIAEQSIPLLIDCFYSGPTLNDERLHPAAYLEVARRHPKLPIILAHSGGHKTLDAFLVAKANPNVLLESSLTLSYFPETSIERDLVFAINHFWPGRTLYGSDFPQFGIGEYLQNTRRVLDRLSDDRVKAFYGETASALYAVRA